jgi:hypothetical protein
MWRLHRWLRPPDLRPRTTATASKRPDLSSLSKLKEEEEEAERESNINIIYLAQPRAALL